jgi:hypothetical protein
MIASKTTATTVDWNQLFIDLSKCGLTMLEISETTGIPKTTLMDYKNSGAEPPYSNAVNLLALWKKKRKVRVDWFRVLVELEGKGYRLNQIAAATDVPRRTLLDWRNMGTEPSHAGGERLIDLWSQVMGEPRDALPLNVHDLLSAARAKA